MIDTTAENVMALVQSAIEERNKKQTAYDDSRARYQGPDRAQSTMKDESCENVEFQFIARRVPEMAFDLPAVRCDSPRMDLVEDVANFDRAMNQWIHSSDLDQVSELTAVDFNFGWACILVNRKPRAELGEVEMHGGGKAVPTWPCITRLSPKQAFKDPLSTNPYSMRYAGCPIVADKEDLLAECDRTPEDGWIRSAIEAMTEDGGLDKLNRPKTGGPTRKEVTYYQVWIGDAEIDWKTECLQEDGSPLPEEKRYLYNGKTFYIATTFPSSGKKTSGFIRKPVPYFGPATGPFVFFGEHVVPDDPDFMSTLTPNAASIRFLNQAIAAINRGIRTRKSITIVNDIAEGLEEKIVEAGDQTVHVVSGFESNQATTLESGGVTSQMNEGALIIRDRTDRGLGMDDAQYGRADAQASATAVATAAASSGALSDRARSKFVSGIRRTLVTVGFYLWYDQEFATPISLPEAVKMGDSIDQYVDFDEHGQIAKVYQPMVYGGTDKEHSYASLQLTIEPYSMERMSQAVAARNAATLVETVQVLAPLVIETPGVNGPVLMHALAKYTRIPEMEHVFDWHAIAQFQHSQALAAYADKLAGAQPELAGPPSGASAQSPSKATTPGSAGPKTGAGPSNKPVKPGGFQGKAEGGQAGHNALRAVRGGAA